jgi:hypothetical protein
MRTNRSTVRPVRCATPRRIAVDLTPRAVEQIAGRVAQLLTHHHQQQQAQQTERLLSAGELALRLGVTRPWVYKYRHLLGGHRIGDGTKAQWRFDRATAMRALERQGAAQRTDGGR